MSADMKIDFHAHMVDREYIDDLIATLKLTAEKTDDGKILYRHRGYTVSWARDEMFDVDARLRDMDAKAIDMRVLSLSTPNVYPWPADRQIEVARKTNNATARLCRAHPDRFVGFASLPLSDMDASLNELDRAVEDLGMKGVAIGSNINGMQLDDPALEPMWIKIDQMKLPVFEHPMFPRQDDGLHDFELPLRLGLIFDTTLSATRLIYSGIFERYPNFPYIMAHTGGALLMALERLDNGYRLFPDCRRYISKLPSEYAKKLYYDTTAFGVNALKLAIDTVGVDQIVFGTDDPFINADGAHVERLALTSENQNKIFYENAAKLLEIKP
jgi:aminocarboxymuconate-semialdehyde decarboxylase